MTLIATYLLTFVRRPRDAFWVLARQKPRASVAISRCCSPFWRWYLVAFTEHFPHARWLGRSLSDQAGSISGLVVDPAGALAGLDCVLALCVQAVRRHHDAHGRARGAKMGLSALGAMATTLPWFGLHIAQMMAG